MAPSAFTPEDLANFGVPSLDVSPRFLLLAAKKKQYRALYSLLDQLSAPLESELAHKLALYGLQCSIRAFRAILDHCPPVDTFACMPPLPFDGPPSSLADEAARLDRPEHLDELLRRGCDPNGDPETPGSTPLAAALQGQSPDCVKRLLREPQLDCTLSDGILSAWARLGLKNTEKLRRCCLAAAPRLLREPYASPTGPTSYQGVPLPLQVNISYALRENNWELAVYLCRREGLSVENGLRYCNVLRAYLLRDVNLRNTSGAPEWRQKSRRKNYPPFRRRDMAALLDGFFTACPQLLRRRLPRTLLFLTALTGKRVPPVLRPWLEQIPSRTVVLDPAVDLANLALILPLWGERLGARWVPALDPRSAVEYSTYALKGPDPMMNRAAIVSVADLSSYTYEDLELLLTRCKILDFRPARHLTGLSTLTLHLAPIPLLIQQLRPGGLLSKEDPRVLLDYCQTVPDRDTFWGPAPLRSGALECIAPLSDQRRQAVYIHLQAEVDYEL